MKLTLHHLTSNLPMRLIDLDLRPYLERYHLAAIGNCRVWLHHFVSADADRNVHDHPWPALSIIFRGGYRELVENPDGSFDIIDRNAWSFNWIPAHKRHRIIEMKPGTWSLMLVGPRHGRGWFVYNEDGTRSHESDIGRNLDWHKTAGNRAAAYEKLEQLRRAAGLSTPEHFNCRCVMQPVTKHAGDALIYALQGTGRRAGKNAAVLKMMESKNGSVLRFPDGEPIKSLADEELDRTLESINRSRKFIYGSATPPLFHDGNGHITHIGFDPASPDEVVHDEAFYYTPPFRRPRLTTQFEWLTRCQRELARLTNNYVGDWGPNAFYCYRRYWPFMAENPEGAAERYMNDEFKNGL